MSAKLLTTRALADAAGMSVGHCFNIISGGEDARPGRERIEAILGCKIWPTSNKSRKRKPADASAGAVAASPQKTPTAEAGDTP